MNAPVPHQPPSDNKAARFLDSLIENYRLKNDAALCRFLGIKPPVVSKIRHGVFGVSAHLAIIIHLKTDIPIRVILDETREVAGEVPA